MPYKIQPLIPERVILSTVWGEQTLVELRHSNAKIIAFLEGSTFSSVHIIVDALQLRKVPRSISSLQKTLSYGRHPRMGWVLMVGGQSRFIQMVAGLLGKVASVQYRHVNSLAEAIRFLKEQD